jgi:hypothetical protein
LAASTPSALAVDCDTEFLGYHYSIETTGTVSEFNNRPDGCFEDPYFGWAGTNGTIIAPAHFPAMATTFYDHSLGFIESSFNSPGGWVQIGWYGGSVGDCSMSCARRASGLGNYLEVVTPTPPTYSISVLDFRGLAYNYASVYNVVYNAAGCWNVYYDNGTYLGNACGMPSSGFSAAASEVVNCHEQDSGCGSSSAVEMPLTYYGNSNPNVNAALRIKGSGGYEPWDSSLSVNYTVRYDERTTSPTYYLSAFNAWYYVKAFD